MQPRVAALFRAALPDTSPGTATQHSRGSEAGVGFWVYENWVAAGHQGKVHRGECGFCNHGAGVHGGGQTRNGRWLGPFRTPEEAKAAAERAGAEVRACSRCMLVVQRRAETSAGAGPPRSVDYFVLRPMPRARQAPGHQRRAPCDDP